MTEPTPDHGPRDPRLPGPPRRTVLRAAAGVGAVGLLAACGGGSDSAEPSGSATNGDATNGEQPSSASSSPGGEASGGGGQSLTTTSAVPVGSGIILADQKVVVTQPTAGQFKAFSAVCTHQACLVDKVEGKTISCPCHGSTYSVADGSVTGGPAPRALPAVQVRVEGDEVVEA